MEISKSGVTLTGGNVPRQSIGVELPKKISFKNDAYVQINVLNSSWTPCGIDISLMFSDRSITARSSENLSNGVIIANVIFPSRWIMITE